MARLAISLAGAAVGNLIAPGIGGQIGFALGSAAGSVLFAEDLPTQYGPKIEDGKVTTSTYGAMLPKVYGTVSVSGNIIDIGSLITVSHKEESGGKGGPTQETVTYTQYMDYDVAVCDEADGIVQIFANEKLIYDASPSAKVQRPSWLQFTFYDGSDTQYSDPTFQTIHGANGVPAYRGTAHVVFRRFNVTEFGTTAINFRFVVTSNGTPSVASWTYTQTDEGSSYAMCVHHNTFADLMIASVTHAADAGDEPRTKSVIAIDPYNHSEVWAWYQEDPSGFGSAQWVDSFSFYVTDELGIPLYQPNQFVAIYHRGESFVSPNKRYLQLLYADSGLELGRVALVNSGGSPATISAYDDDAIFYQCISPAVGDRTLYRVVISPGLGVSSVQVSPASGYKYGSNAFFVFAAKGSRFAGRDAILLANFENSTTGAFGCSIFTDIPPGDGATALSPIYSTVDEYATASGQPVDAVYDEDMDCFWVLFAGSSNTQIAKVSIDGVIESETDWNTTFSISGATSSDSRRLVLDQSSGLLWVVIAGVAYSWPTYDLTQTPTGYGSGLTGNASAWHPYTGTLFQGNGNDPEYTQHRLQALTGAGVSLQSVVEGICDEPGTNLLPGDRDASALAGITVDGFRLTRVMQRRQALQELQLAYLWDFVPRAGVLTAILRGGSSVATLDDDDVGAHLYGTEAPRRLAITRVAGESLPNMIGVSFIDASQNYDTGYEPASRQASAGGTERRLQIGVVLSHDDAAQLASVLLHSAHIEAETYEATCMPSLYGTVQPAAIVTVDIDGTAYPMRCDSASIVDGGIVELRGLRHDASVYTDYSVGGVTRGRVVSITAAGPTTLFLLDIPALREADFNAGLYMAGNSYAPTWTGAEVYSSVNGVDYSSVGLLTSRATAGYVQEALPSAPAGRTDLTSTLKVRLISGSLSSTDHDTMAMDKTVNIAAVGSAGRWEILRFQTASQDADGIWNITGLHRAIRDTLSGANSHAAGDKFVLLDANDARRVIIENSDIGSVRYFKGVTIGRNIAQAPAQATTPLGAGLKPFRPACLHASQSAGNWTLTWARQDKKQARFLQQPVMSESTESYTIDILDLGGNVLNTYTSSSETMSYTTTLQSADFGGTVNFLKWRVAQVSAVVGAGPYTTMSSGLIGSDYTATVTARGSIIDFWPLNEAAGSTIYSNSGTHNGVGFEPINYNQSAICDDGAKTILTTGLGRFDISGFASMANVRAVEYWFDFAAVPSATAVLVTYATGGKGFHIYMTSTGQVGLMLEDSGTVLSILSTATWSSGTLHVVANFDVVTSGTAELLVNGIEVASGTLTGNVAIPTGAQLSSGSAYWATATANLDRYSNKLALYDTKLTPAEVYADALIGFGP